jgi:hypothetical protein
MRLRYISDCITFLAQQVDYLLEDDRNGEVDQLHLRLIHDQLERLRDIALRSGTHDQLAAIKRLQRTLWAYV